jgi:four helix bundle protein|tara:strand:+ start:48 stop:428 length:381 start_codon:yes stop_codon:yes gene_type:complete
MTDIRHKTLDFRKLKFWHKARKLVKDIYLMTRGLPTGERFGLTSQIQRATVSIAANIAEGCGRGSKADLARFLQISIGSCSEVDCLLVLLCDLEYLKPGTATCFCDRVQEIQKMLNSYVSILRSNQ